MYVTNQIFINEKIFIHICRVVYIRSETWWKKNKNVDNINIFLELFFLVYKLTQTHTGRQDVNYFEKGKGGKCTCRKENWLNYGMHKYNSLKIVYICAMGKNKIMLKI